MVRAVPEKKRSRVANEILEGLTALRDAVSEGVPLGKRFTVRTVKLVLTPEEMPAEQIRMLRSHLSASQSVFAAVLGVSVDALQSWEQGRRAPSESARRMMHIFKDDPKLFTKQIRLKAIR